MVKRSAKKKTPGARRLARRFPEGKSSMAYTHGRVLILVR
jgi:hypothetical protein